MAEPSRRAAESYAILCGAGEDVSFDLEVQRRFGLTCIIVDPTPRAIAHWEELLANTTAGINTPINGDTSKLYDTSGVNFNRMQFNACACWIRDEIIRFWEPDNPNHVSHSIANIQGTDSFIEVPARTLSSICNASPKEIELVKLDVEGIGPAMIEWMIEQEYFPEQILVEFEECLRPSWRSFGAVKRAVTGLERQGYSLVHFDGQANCAFVRQTKKTADLRAAAHGK